MMSAITSMTRIGHSGKGYYFWMTEYPEEGAMKLDIESGAEG